MEYVYGGGRAHGRPFSRVARLSPRLPAAGTFGRAAESRSLSPCCACIPVQVHAYKQTRSVQVPPAHCTKHLTFSSSETPHALASLSRTSQRQIRIPLTFTLNKFLAISRITPANNYLFSLIKTKMSSCSSKAKRVLRRFSKNNYYS